MDKLPDILKRAFEKTKLYADKQDIKCYSGEKVLGSKIYYKERQIFR